MRWKEKERDGKRWKEKIIASYIYICIYVLSQERVYKVKNDSGNT